MTSRAYGRRNPARIDPDSPEGRDIGLSVRQDPSGSPIPGQTGNIVNYETVRQPVAKEAPAKDEFTGIMAHGVPNDSYTTEEHAASERGNNARKIPAPGSADIGTEPAPVPVYIVEGGTPSVIRSAYPRHITVPNSATDAVRVCGRSPRRLRIGLLNEDQATDIRFAQRPSDLNIGGGALLPWPTNSYSWLDTQDELYAVTVSASATALLSIIEVFEQEM